MGLRLDVEFTCINCGETAHTNVEVPVPDYRAESARDSQNEDWVNVVCNECGYEYEAYVTNSFYGAYCQIKGVLDGEIHGLAYDPVDEADFRAELEWEMSTSQQYEVLTKHLSSVHELVNLPVDEIHSFSLNVMLHSYLVSALEGYLSSTFIHKVTNSEKHLRKLVEYDEYFSKQRLSLKEIFEKQESLKMTVAKYLKDLVFHNVEKIAPMYKNVIGFDFGDFGWLGKAVSIRHDCVHRAGYSKEGNQVAISKKTIRELASKISSLAYEIEEVLNTGVQSSALDWGELSTLMD